MYNILNYAQKKYAALDILNKNDKSTESDEQKSQFEITSS